MLCKLDNEARYVRSGEKCLPCDSKQESTMKFALAACVLLMCGIAAYIFHRATKSASEAACSPALPPIGRSRHNAIQNDLNADPKTRAPSARAKSILFDADMPSRFEVFVLKVTAKYKIIVPFTQVRSNISTIHKLRLCYKYILH